MHEAVRGLRLRRLRRVLVIAEEDAGGAVEHLAVLGDADLDLRRRPPDRVGADLAIGLHGDVDRSFRLPVELLQVHPDRAVEAEDLRADRFARGVADLDAREPEAVLQRAVDEDVADIPEQAVEHADARCAVEDFFADLVRLRDEELEHPPLQRRRVLHAHHGQGQHGLEHPRRREGVGCADLAPVLDDGIRAFRTVDAEPGEDRLRVGEDVVADPGDRQVGDDLVPLGELVEIAADLRRGDDVVVGQHHALRPPGGAGGVEDDRQIGAAPRGEVGLEGGGLGGVGEAPAALVDHLGDGARRAWS